MADRQDIEYLLTAEPVEFTIEEAVEALLLLEDSIDDIKFQLEDVPKSKFQGSNYDNWKIAASYKKNRILAARRRFKYHIQTVLQKNKESKLMSIIGGMLKADPVAFQEARKLV